MKSWKTSLAGILGGLVLTFGPSVGGRLTGDHAAPPITFSNYGPAIVLAAIGLLSKDYDKTNAPRPIMTQSSSGDPSTPRASSSPSAGNPNFPSSR